MVQVITDHVLFALFLKHSAVLSDQDMFTDAEREVWQKWV